MPKEIQKNDDISLDKRNNHIIEDHFRALDKKYLQKRENNISEKAYKSARDFTERVLTELKEQGKNVMFPKIVMAGKESFDVYWKSKKFKVLINIHKTRNGIVHMFGKDFPKPNNPIDTKVNFELSIDFLINWLNGII